MRIRYVLVFEFEVAILMIYFEKSNAKKNESLKNLLIFIEFQ